MTLLAEEIYNGWYLDSGATHYVTNDLNNLLIKLEFKGGEKLVVGNGKTLAISYNGSALIRIPNHKPLLLNDILYVP